MLRLSLFATILIGITSTSSSGQSGTIPTDKEDTVGIEGCDYNLMFLEIGDSVFEGCEECRCTAPGVMECTENTACCLYSVKRGRTKRAYPGESFNDGCNKCLCGDDGLAACTRKACPDKCPFKNWDLVPGYAGKGKVFAFDEKDQCPKACKCKVKKGNVKLKCRSPCIAF
ncbi:hypothetical protein ACHWQZ_G009606 [Mnemiopsis leidyi]